MTYRVAIVGCGAMGVGGKFNSTFPFVYNYAEAVLKNPRALLVALVDFDRAKAQEADKNLSNIGYGSPRTLHASLSDAVEQYRRVGTPIDIVCCAGGPKANVDVIEAAHSLGIRGVYCDKPLALSLSELDRIADIEASTGLKVQVNYLRNLEASHRAVVDYVKEGKLGDLLLVRCLYKGGVLAVAPHALALLQRMLGQPTEVVGSYSPLVNERCPDDPNIDGIVRYRFAPQGRDVNALIAATGNGIPGNNTYLFEFEFTGTKGRISILENGWRIRYERMEPSRVFHAIGSYMPYDTASVPLELKPDSPREFMLEGLDLLIDAVEHDIETGCNAAAARDAEEVAHALGISAKMGRPVSFPLHDRSHGFKAIRVGVDTLSVENQS